MSSFSFSLRYLWSRQCAVISLAAVVAFAWTPRSAAAQVALVFGGSILKGTLQTPYVYRCSGSQSNATGMMPYVGFGVGAASITAGYVQVNGDGNDDCIIKLPPDGVHRVRDFRATHTSIYGWGFHLRYSPDRLPFLGYVGTGFRFGGNELGHNRFVSVGAAFRTTGRLSVFVGGEVTQLRTYFVQLDQTWQDGVITSSTEIDDGYGWRKLEVIRFGAEYRWRIRGR